VDRDQPQKLTSGHLPLSAFEHMEPTGVGVVDLDRSLTPHSPDGRALRPDQRDGLLLVRLHHKPIAMVHIDRALGKITSEELATQIWSSAGAAICGYLQSVGCEHLPTGPDTLADATQRRAQEHPADWPTNPGRSIAVIIPTIGREEQLGRCLRSLLAQREAQFEVIVVDNQPSSGEALRTVTTLASEDARVRYVAESRGGSSVARNRGVSETDAELVAFTDDDVVLDPTWLQWLISPFAEPDVTATCGMVLPLELDTEAQKRFELHGGFSRGLRCRHYDLKSGRDTGLLYPFMGDLFGSGNSMAFSRAELVAAGGFDPALGGGTPAKSGEDIYAFSTAVLRGGRLAYEPRALCWHEHRRDGRSLSDQIFDYGVGIGAIVTKALLSGDPRFFGALASSARLLLGPRQQSSFADDEAKDSVFPEGMIWTQRAGMLRGPWRYVSGRARARRRHFGNAIRGF
jgi:O-antigen biosynthesis protein